MGKCRDSKRYLVFLWSLTQQNVYLFAVGPRRMLLRSLTSLGAMKLHVSCGPQPRKAVATAEQARAKIAT